MSIVSGSSAVRGLRGAISWVFFAGPGEPPVPLAVLLTSAGAGVFVLALGRLPARGTALAAAGTVEGASLLALLSRSVTRLLARAAEMPVRAFGTMEALLVEGIAATTLGVRGVSSACPDFAPTNLRSVPSPPRTSRGVIREVTGGCSDAFGSRPLGGGFDSLTDNVQSYAMNQLRRQNRQLNGAATDNPASSPDYAMGIPRIAGDWGANMAKW